MYLIKACPSCRTKLRFPIDKGTIKIHCSCGNSFIANPDDTAIYTNAVFDLSSSKCVLKKMAPLTRALAGFKFNQIIPAIIRGILKWKYRLQNYRLLPDDEKRKIILFITLIGAGIAGLIAALYLMLNYSTEKIII
jgi:LSD1 subclass zinc finger protein